MRFRGVVQLNGKTATGIEVPPDVLAALGTGKHPKVVVSMRGHTYRTSVGSMGGRMLLPVSAEVRAATGVVAGDEVEVALEPDTEPRTVDVPSDLTAGLKRHPEALRAFERLSYSHQRRYVLAIEAAKTAPTRARRITTTVAALEGGGPGDSATPNTP